MTELNMTIAGMCCLALAFYIVFVVGAAILAWRFIVMLDGLYR